MRAPLTRQQRDDLLTTYEEAAARPRNSPGAWHMQLIALVRNMGHEIHGYEQAKNIAGEVLEMSRLDEIQARLDELHDADCSTPYSYEHAQFIAKAPDDIRWLIGEVERLRGEVGE